MIGKHVVLTLVVGAAIGSLLWRFAPKPWTGMQVAGLGLIAAGFILWTTARFQLGSSFAVTAQARQLVTHGLYAKIGNPIYVFGSWVIAGGFLMARRPMGLLIFLVLIPLQIWRSGKESAVLEAKFGDEYRQYRAGTWF
jgi:protein-S-isoprenylcysteine O-methyltransferase Ste14